MKHLIFFHIAIFSLLNFANAQEEPTVVSYGTINLEELQSVECNYYPNAKAEFLISKGVLNITSEKVSLYVHKRIKIYSNEGKNYATIKIPLYAKKGGAKEIIRKLSAVCYNLEDGEILKSKLNKEDRFEKRLNEYYNEVSFVIPNVKIGSIFEYSYTIESKAYRNIKPWQLQFDIPVAYNYFEYKVAKWFVYKIYLTGNIYDKETGKTTAENWGFDSYEGKIWSYKNSPIYKEPYQPNMDDVYGKINFQLTSLPFSKEDFSTSYDALNKSLLLSEYFGKHLNKKGILKTLNIEKALPDINFAKDIYYTLTSKVSWNNIKGTGSYVYGKKFIASSKKGSIADINLTLVAALNEGGFIAAPILVSTRGNGKPHPEFADLKRFDYVVAGVKIEGDWIVLDATSTFPFNKIPNLLLNGNAYIIHPTENGWINFNEDKKGNTSIYILANLKNNVYTEEVSIKQDDYEAYPIIDRIKEIGLDEFKKEIAATFENIITDINIPDVDYNKPLIIQFKHKEEFDDVDILYVDPIKYGGITENIFERDVRFSPVEFAYANAKKVVYKLNYSKEWEPVISQNQKLSLEDKKTTFSYLSSNEFNSVDIISNYKRTDLIFPVNEYNSLKKFFEGMTNLNNEVLTLKKLR